MKDFLTKTCFIGRNGSIELSAILHYGSVPDIMERHTGIWPTEKLSQWHEAYIEANQCCDVIAAGWYQPLAKEELEMLQRINPNVTIVPLRSLEPYYEPDPTKRWTRELRGKRIAVINSFVDTMMKQLLKRELIWGQDADSLLPNAHYLFYKTGFTPKMAGNNVATRWPPHVTDWSSAVIDIVQTVLRHRPDVALIGCGGLGMIVAKQLKDNGVSCVVMGGAIQVLFGIKGRRWETHPVISKFWNEHWVHPSPEECPELCHTVEQGCYV